jgi:hypothetical protein
MKVAAFISIPKCASNTIREMYQLGFNRDNDSDCCKNNYVIYENHQRLCVLEKRYDLENTFVFTFVKNPYERVRSWFYYHNYNNITLNEWIKKGCKTHWKKQNMTNWVKENKSPLLQYNFIEANKKVDFIGKMENFEEDKYPFYKK